MVNDDCRRSDAANDGADNAAGYNNRVMRKLGKALARQPDLDLSLALPPRYRLKLAAKKQLAQVNPTSGASPRASSPPTCAADIQTPNPPQVDSLHIDVSLPASVLYPLSATVESMLSGEQPRWSESGCLSLALSGILRSAAILFQSETDHNHFVARCSDNIVVKAISTEDSTEYTTLKFLETRSPAFLAPVPHGVVVLGKVWYMFMSLIPGVSLESVWQDLEDSEKRSVSFDLDEMLMELRKIPFEHGHALGGVDGQGCKDTRRHSRTATAPIYTREGLWEFMYGCARNRDTVYGKFLRSQTFPPREQRIVFIHGDFRPANVMVHRRESGNIQITGLIDWEMSGFYPEDLECVKALNNLSPIGKDDWYLFLPKCISPRNHLESWHADLVWDSYVV
ncbi:hypothetical protein Q7P37_000229 [Cladosporium fusiforme]